MKKTAKVALIISILVILSFQSFAVTAKEYDKPVLLSDDIEEGIITVEIPEQLDNDYKVMVKKEDTTYFYGISEGSSSENFPLQMGNGEYNVAILEKIEGNNYKFVQKEDIVVDIEDENKVFLNSIQYIDWDEEDRITRAAKLIDRLGRSDEQKIEQIHKYVLRIMRYDYEKAENIQSGYVPDLDELFSEKKGICFDYSAIFAAMARSIGIPAKIIMGDTDNVNGYHAWNEVYIEGTWLVIDATYDSIAQAKGYDTSMYKDSTKYFAKKEY